ncbi:hypothetical protein FV222_02270 [Methylobacterium sp. WL103]|uniref:hypothetical protein n=1 Tax=Methylobacterium sp. WL103 TaxID=2603891 RepID=UPI0011CCABAA|nr:hypothetical protein [Methylobacterium sp. WL103]TXN07509.1 hypothetical protein FV222_02270 [Methylobacterium sp. WL103]
MRRSISFRDYHETTGKNKPSDDLSLYSNSTFDDGNLQALSGSVIRLYSQAKAGDLVIVPGRDEFEGMLRSILKIGEIASEFDPTQKYTGDRLSTKNVPIRDIKWLNTVPRREVSLHLERKIGRPPAIRRIKIDKDSEDLLKYAYKSYIFAGNSSSLISADKYDGADFVILNQSSDLIAFLVAAHAVFSADGNNDFPVIDDVRKFTREHFSEASVDNIVVDFASPGYWRIIGASVSLAAFVGLGVTVLTSDASVADLKSGIIVENSVSPNDPTAHDLEVSMNHFLKSIGKVSLKDAMKEGNEARKIIGLSSPAQVKK